MAGTRDGARKRAAAAIGCSVGEYIARLQAGEKWCTGCKAWHPTAVFASDASRPDGFTAACRESRNASGRGRYTPRARPARGRSFVPARDGDKEQARRRVNYFVEAGLLPAPNACPCVDCGHVWAEGEKRHEYDHHLGYAAEHHEHVEAVCSGCHHERERKRGNSR